LKEAGKSKPMEKSDTRGETIDSIEESNDLEQALKNLGFDLSGFSEKAEDGVEEFDETAILRKKVRRLEKDNFRLLERISEAEHHAVHALQQNYMLREEVKAAFMELSSREGRTVEKNTLPFEGERTKPLVLAFVTPTDLKGYRKEKKVTRFSYPMGIEQNKWIRN